MTRSSSSGFHTALEAPFDDLPVSYAGVDPVPGLPPAITALDGPGSEGLGLRQKYSVRILVRSNGVTRVFSDERRRDQWRPRSSRCPSNVGVADHARITRPWRAKGIFRIAGNAIPGVRRTAQGDLLHRSGVRVRYPQLPAEPAGADQCRGRQQLDQPFGINDFEGLNVNTIAVEIPIAALPPVVGIVCLDEPVGIAAARLAQVARMANPARQRADHRHGLEGSLERHRPVDEAQFLGSTRSRGLAIC
jgi:hypothetical protein